MFGMRKKAKGSEMKNRGKITEEKKRASACNK